MFFGMMGAMALSFNACSSDDALVDNPNYDAKKGEVATNFVFNISTGNSGTRMGADVVQQNNNFRGMENVKMFTVKQEKCNFVTDTATTDAFTKEIDLGSFLSVDQINHDLDKGNSRRTVEVTLPLQTNAMLFYGFAPASTDSEKEGKMTWTINKDKSQTNFNLVSRLEEGSEKETEYNQTLDLAAWIVNRCLDGNQNGTYTDESNKYGNGAGATLSNTLEGIYTMYKDNDPNLCELGKIMGEALDKARTIPAVEYRAGSAAAVGRMLSDLHAVFLAIGGDGTTANPGASPTSMREEVAKVIAHNVAQRIARYVDASAGKLKDLTSIHTNMTTNAGVAETDWSASYGKVKADNLANYPASFGLPMGATIMTFDTTNKLFSFKNSDNSLLAKGKTTDVNDIKFPVELGYYVNSGLRTSDIEHDIDDYPNGVNPWNNDGNWTTAEMGFTHDKVLSSTRSVAMKTNVNYGVAALDTRVKYGAQTLYDNTQGLFPEEEPQEIEANASAFALTGVLVGGQIGQMGWNYINATATDGADKYVVYDNRIAGNNAGTGVSIPAYTAAGAYSTDNYTLLFDNYLSDTQKDVLVALEFKNNSGKDFWGKENMVRKEGTFYLLGKLELGTKTVTFPTDHIIPPYDFSGSTPASTQTTRVFIQDFLTKANFTIGANSLKEAYVTVPDLRSAQMTMALSVDIEWLSGIEFDVDLGGLE